MGFPILKQNSMTLFYVVRHGEATGNVDNILMGHYDCPLTKKGREQAINVQKNLNHISFDYVFTSDLTRAYETAKIIASPRGMKVLKTKALRERYCAELEGVSKDVLNKRYKKEIELLQKQSVTKKMNHRYVATEESGREVVNRVLSFFAEVATQYPNATVLVVSHSGVIGNFLSHIGQHPYDGMFGAAKMENGGYIKFESDGHRYDIKQIFGMQA